jgi:hypothetical protein
MRRSPSLMVLLLAALTCSSCAGHRSSAPQPDSQATLAIDLARTRPLGIGLAFRPPRANALVSAAAPIGALRCRGAAGQSYGAHIELFASDREVQVPAGIGISGGRQSGPFVVSARCRYRLSTVDPTGVIHVQRQPELSAPTVGELFSLWGQRLSRTQLGSFQGTVVSFLDGRRWPADPRHIPLRPHAQIVLEVGPFVAPHPSYLFPPGL